MYVENLNDLPALQLRQAFARAPKECEKFPSVVELRRLATGGTKPERSVEAQAAWDEVMRYVKQHGVERMPVYVRGKGLMDPPALSPEIEYALRRIGGLQALRGPDMDTAFPFLMRDFCAAFIEAPVADLMGLLPEPQVRQQVLPPAPMGEVVSFPDVMKQVSDMSKSKGMPEHERKLQASRERPRLVTPPIVLTKEQIEQRRAAERAESERVRREMEEGA